MTFERLWPAGDVGVSAPQYWLLWIGLILVLLVLTDRERMTDTAAARSGPWTLSRAYAMFPRLKERRSNLGNQLSGGEQQMQSIARALVLNPKLMLLDEPKGLALIIIEELLAALKRIIREEGMSAIAVEQHAQKILGVIDSAVILDRGTVVHASSGRALIDDPTALEQHLGTTAKKKSGRTLSGPSNVGEGAIRSSR